MQVVPLLNWLVLITVEQGSASSSLPGDAADGSDHRARSRAGRLRERRGGADAVRGCGDDRRRRGLADRDRRGLGRSRGGRPRRSRLGGSGAGSPGEPGHGRPRRSGAYDGVRPGRREPGALGGRICPPSGCGSMTCRQAGSRSSFKGPEPARRATPRAGTGTTWDRSSWACRQVRFAPLVSLVARSAIASDGVALARIEYARESLIAAEGGALFEGGGTSRRPSASAMWT